MKENKTTRDADALAEEARGMLGERYNFDGPGWNGGPMHSVNVKRYSDYVNDDERADIAARVCKQYSLGTKDCTPVREYIDDYAENNDAYWEWLQWEWDTLDYQSIEPEITGREYQYIARHAYGDKGPRIVARGRSGGHACFNSDLEALTDELENVLYHYQHNEYDTTARDVREAMRDVREAIDDVQHLQNFIAEYNDALSWSDELEYRADEYARDVREAIDAHTRKRKAEIAHNVPLLART